MSDSWHTIVHSAKRFFTGTVFSRISGMLRDMSMAYAFGATPLVATFLLAFRLSNLFRRLLGEGALQSAFIPLFETVRAISPLRGAEFFRNLSASVALLLLLIIAVLGVGLLGVGSFVPLSTDMRELLLLTAMMLPGLLFFCLYGIYAALLQCNKSYFIPAIAPAAFNLVWVAGVLLIYNEPLPQAMYQLAAIVVFAALCQWLVTVPSAWALLQRDGLPAVWRGIEYKSDEVRRLLIPLCLGIGGVAATQVNNALDGLFGWWADPSGPAYLWYALRLQQLPLSLWGIALSGALLPPLCRAAKESDPTLFQTFFTNAMQKTLLWMVLATAWFFAAGHTWITLLFGHGDFTAHDIAETTHCLWGYSVGLTPMILVLITAAAFYARGNFRTPMQASILSVIANISFNTLFIGVFGWGAMSVAMATSLSALLNYSYLRWALRRSGKTVALGAAYLQAIVVGASAFFAAIFIDQSIWGNSPAYHLLFREQLPLYGVSTYTGEILRCTVQGLPFLAAAFVVYRRSLLNKI